jgi:predicted adenylyl cyclase CyaB
MKNLEIKCRFPDHRRGQRIALDDLGAYHFGVIHQTDTYFPVTHGRLKLRHDRTEKGEHFELIAYDRPNGSATRVSDYQRLPLPDGPAALRVLDRTLGILVRVQKVRQVYLKDNLRIHLDSIRGLGKFLEFELITSSQYPLARCRRQMRLLQKAFAIPSADLIDVSYSDLLLKHVE